MSVNFGRIILGTICVAVANIVILACGALQGISPGGTWDWLFASSYWTANVFLGGVIAVWINDMMVLLHLDSKLKKLIKIEEIQMTADAEGSSPQNIVSLRTKVVWAGPFIIGSLLFVICRNMPH